MSFKAFSTLCCGKGSHKTILEQFYIPASFLPYQMKRQNKIILGFCFTFNSLLRFAIYEYTKGHYYPRKALIFQF